MASSSSDANDPLFEAVQMLPRDTRNTGPETRARFEYQDECVALTLLDHFGADLRGVLIEHSTDLILLPTEGLPELVSIKHREPHHKGDATWTWAAMQKDRVLIDLHSAWKAAGKACTVAFHSNAGFGGPANVLRQATTLRDVTVRKSAIAQLRDRLRISEADAEEFLDHLNFPKNPLPRRNEITDVGVRRTADVLRSLGRSPLHAESCYGVLLERIASAGTDRPKSRMTDPLSTGATIRACVELEHQQRLREKFISVEDVRRLMLVEADRQEAHTIPASRHPGREPDPLFVGRAEQLKELERLLMPGSPDPVAPVVIHGMTGAGKTSLAVQFSAIHAGKFRVEVVDGSNRASLRFGLEELTGGASSEGPLSEIGWSAVSLPETSALLVIIDGVTDPAAIRGVVPRRSRCRVLVTTTAAHIDEGYHHIPLPPWSQGEAQSFISRALPTASVEEISELGDFLGNHPLAIGQAVNYCLTVGISVSQYMDRLRKKSTQLLSRGQANNYPVPVASAVMLAITAAEERNSLARNLLTLLSHIGPEPLQLDIFDEEPVRPLIVGMAVTVERKRRILRRRPVHQISWGAFAQSDLGWKARIVLHDPIQRDDAIACLLAFSLINVERGHIAVHPLISLLVAENVQDSDPWVETAFGLFTSQLTAGAGLPEVLDPHVGHIARIVDGALGRGMHGPAVMAVAKNLVDRLCALGDEGAAVRMGGQVLEISERLFSLKLAPISLLYAARESLGRALMQAGDPERGISLIQDNVELAERCADQSSIDAAYLALGSAGVRLARREIAEVVIPRLPDLSKLGQLGPDDDVYGLGAAHVRLGLLRLTNQFEEAADLSSWCLSRLEVLKGRIPADMVATIHADAAMLARLQGDVETQAKHMKEAADAQDLGRSRRDRFPIEMQLNAADAAIESAELSRADQILANLEPILSSQFGLHSSIYASFLAIRGRCRLHQAIMGTTSVAEAKVDLSRAIDILRMVTGAERGQLASGLIHLSSVAAIEGDEEAAVAFAEEAYEEDLRMYGLDHPETQMDLMLLSSIPMQIILYSAMNLHFGEGEPGD